MDQIEVRGEVRHKLLDAIAALRSGAGGKAPSADETTASSPPSVSPEDRAERRPEDLREVISAYQKCVAGTAGRFGGFVAQ